MEEKSGRDQWHREQTEEEGKRALRIVKTTPGWTFIEAGNRKFLLIHDCESTPADECSHCRSADGSLHVIFSHTGGWTLLEKLLHDFAPKTRPPLVLWTSHGFWSTFVKQSRWIKNNIGEVRHLALATVEANPKRAFADACLVVVSFDLADVHATGEPAAVCYLEGPLYLEFAPSPNNRLLPSGMAHQATLSAQPDSFDTSIKFNDELIVCRYPEPENGKSPNTIFDKKMPASWQYPNVITEIPDDSEWPDSAGNLKIKIEQKNKDRAHTGSGQDEALVVDIEQQREVFADCAVAIQAGVVPIIRGAVHPGRRIEVAVPDDTTGSCIMSIIEWRLRQLAQIHFSLNLPQPIPVLLIVSYQTRSEISAILHTVLDMPCDDTGPVDLLESRIKVFLLQQPLVRWVASPDGLRTLRRAGHLDLLRLAVHWHRTCPLNPKPRYLISFPHNNLGTVLDQAELTANLLKFRAQNYLAAVELFDQRTHDHPRYSYQFDDYLWKSDYTPPDPIPTKIAQAINTSEIEQNNFKASGHTWYFDLQTFVDKPELIPNFWIKSAEPHKAPRQDLELLTYQPGCSVLGLYYPLDTDDNALKYPRFTVAHHEGEVQSRRIQEAIKAQGPVPFLGTTERKREGINREDLRGRLLLRAIPYDNQNLWGGMLLAGMKGQDERKIGETWEISTHWTGPAAVEHNGQEEPMSLVLDDYPLMLKYLDCEDNLSVQVHPPKRAIDALSMMNSIETGAGSDQEKEESFFVIRASDRTENLLLGFNLERTEAIAQYLRPALYRNADRGNDGNVSETEEWREVTKQLQQAYKSFLEELASKAQSEEAEALRGLAHMVENGDWSKDEDPCCIDLQGAVRFHWNHAKHPAEKKDLGNLLAGVGFIHMLRLLRETLMSGTKDTWHQTAEAWFGASRTNGPLLSFFHRIKLDTSQWMRVPPGLVHAWQGGGNLVMETSNRSDQTYRLFDYGRELIRDPSRPLHYKEAMYALTPEAFIKDGAHQCLTKGDFHRNLNLEVLKGADARTQGLPIRFERKRCGWAFAMNIDNAMEVTAITNLTTTDRPVHGQQSGECSSQSDGQQAEYLSVPPLSTILFQAYSTLYVTPRELNDRVLVLYDRERDDFKRTLLISLGATKIEVALKTQGVTPPTRYLSATQEQITKQIATASNKLDKSLALAGKLLKQLLKEHRVDRDRYGTLTKVGVTWPGPKFGNKLLSSFLGDVERDTVQKCICEILQRLDLPWSLSAGELTPEKIDIRPDAEVIVATEAKHSRGALPSANTNEPAMVLNIGSGICADFNAAAKVNGWDQGEKSRERKMATAIGRWLRIDVVTGRVTPCWEKVFGEGATAPPLETVDDFLDDKGSGPRLSATLSTIALTLRLLRQLAHAEEIWHLEPEEARESKKLLRYMMLPSVSDDILFSNPMPDHDNPLFSVLTAKPYATAYACIKKCRHQVNRFKFFNYISQAGFRRDGDDGGHLDSRRVIRDFVIEVAGDLAATLIAIEQCAPSIGLDPRVTRYCVLTGSIGRDFGREEDDLLLRTLNHLLPKSHIERTNFAVAAEAEIEAFE